MSADDGIGGISTYGAFGTVTLNNIGQVAFLAELLPGDAGTTAGIWSEGDGLGAKLVAVDGGAAGGIDGAIFENLITTLPFINNAGQTLFRGRLDTGPGGVTTSDNSGIWIASAGEAPQLVLREGDLVPGSTSVRFGAQDGFDRQFATFNNVGQTVVHHLLPIKPPTVTGSNNIGIWRSGLGQSTEKIAQEGSFAAGFSPGTVFYGHMAGTPGINDAGQIVFVAPILSFFGQPATGEGIWIGTPGSVDLKHQTGDVAPGIVEVSTFVDFSSFSINNAAGYAFSGFVDDLPSGIESYNDSGIWASRTGGPLELLVREGDNPPDTPTGAGFGFISSVLINSVGEIAFRGGMQGVPGMGFSGVSSTNDEAIWSEGGGGGLREVAREKDQPVGTDVGVEYDFFFDPSINALGQTAFAARLRGTGVDTSNQDGLFAEDINGDLQLVARTGDLLDVDSGPSVDERIITSLFFYGRTGNEDGRRSGFSDTGQLAFSATFSDGTSGVFVSSLVASLGQDGDFDNDGDVDGSDFLKWQRSESASSLSASDLAKWEANFGAIAVSSLTIAVPEPTSCILLSIAFIWTHLQRRRRLNEQYDSFR